MLMSHRLFDSARELERLRDEMGNLFSGVRGAVHEFPPVNIFAGEDEAVVTAELPGVSPEVLELTVKGSALTLRGARPMNETKEGETWLRRERVFGDFSRTIELPFQIDADKVAAKFDKGVLSITLPRAEADKPRKIAVKTA